MRSSISCSSARASFIARLSRGRTVVTKCNSMRNTIRIVVVGCGLIGKKRLESIRRFDEVTLAATIHPVAEPPPDTAVPHHLGLEELPPESYDAAVIAVPHDAAPALTETVLAAGKTVLVEKPLATSLSVGRKLKDLADK